MSSSPLCLSWSRLIRAGLSAVVGAALLSGCAAQAAVPVYGYQVKATYPHDDQAYTEGLFYLDGVLFESTGREGQSFLRKVRLKDGAVLQSQAIPPGLFGEGIVNWGDDIISLTWQDGFGFRWDLKTLARKAVFQYPGEGWALTQDGKTLIMSDGTPYLRFLDPKTFKETHRVRVTAEGRPVPRINELEWVKGEVLANIWLTHRIARINPKTGVVTGWIDLTGLPETRLSLDADSVLNGIAYDREHDRLFVTGKNWPHLYEIGLTPPQEPSK
ncbi:glutaminyl-peptide cyclotransferase [Phenylobacterium aquaticum]|uniref:glutaminyl-peptide cyclotransferase n=1 Tax=Phenylobacterium aquaticum TaxID=1763816 RepID=UPI0026E9590B|nr:glutaminyl-peptide cyclotransferase [Phenylobacterium aquaticum]